MCLQQQAWCTSFCPALCPNKTNIDQSRHASSAEWHRTRALSEVLKALASEYMLRVATEVTAGTVTASENTRPLVELAEA